MSVEAPAQIFTVHECQSKLSLIRALLVRSKGETRRRYERAYSKWQERLEGAKRD